MNKREERSHAQSKHTFGQISAPERGSARDIDVQEQTGIVEYQAAELLLVNRKLQRLTEQHRLLALVAQHTSESVAITDALGKVEFVNPAFERITGYSLSQMRGNVLHEVLAGKDTNPEALQTLITALHSAQTVSVDIVNYTKTGAKYWAHRVLTPVFSQNNTCERFICLEYDITQEKDRQAAEQFRARITLQTLIDSSPSSIVLIDEAFRVLEMNRAAAAMRADGTQTSSTLAIGHDIRLTIPIRRAEFERDVELAFGGKSLTVEYSMQESPESNVFRSFEMQYNPVPDVQGVIRSVAIIMQDITKRKAAEREIKELGANLQALINSSSQAVALLDRHCTVLHVNEGMKMLTLVQTGHEAQLHEDIRSRLFFDGEELYHAVREAFAGKSSLLEHTQREKISNEKIDEKNSAGASTLGKITGFWELYCAPVYTEDDEIFGVALNISDRTEYKRAQEQLAQMNEWLEERVFERTSELQHHSAQISEQNRQLQQLNQELHAINEEKSELMNIVAHDLKNPLTAIRGLADALKNGAVEHEMQTVFGREIFQAAEQMFEFISTLLEANAIESGTMQLQCVRFDIRPFVQMSVEQYRRQAETKHIQIEFVMPAEEICVLADELAINHILDNVLSNAVKYSPHGKRVSVSLSRYGNEIASFVCLEVQDEGEGISASDMKKLFGKFARLSARPTGGETSTGLGLSIVKKLVELMHGRIWCVSEEGKGARFLVELPGVV